MGLTPAALGARVEVEHVLPAEVLERHRAEVLVGLVLRVHDGLDVEDRQPPLRLGRLEEDVGGCGDDVQVLAVAEVDEEAEDEHEVAPEEEAVQADEHVAVRAERREQPRQRAGEGAVGGHRLHRAALRDQRRVVERP